jgi:hypothetical protein
MIPVVIGTNPERSDWLRDCLTSIKATDPRHHPITVHSQGGYEPAALRTGTNLHERFLFLQDSCTILRPEFWDVIDDTEGPAWLAGYPPMHLAIHDSAQLRLLLPDHAVTKDESISMEIGWPRQLNYNTIWPDITDANHLRKEHRHGRDNLVLGNDLFEKHKGTWG